MRMRHRVGLVSSALVGVGLSWMWMTSANAATTIQSVGTAADYRTVTIVFNEGVSGSGVAGDAGEIVAADVSVGSGAGATLTQVGHTSGSATVVLTFSGAVQPSTGITIAVLIDEEPTSFATAVPVAAGDWSAIDASLRAIELPVADVPIAPYLTTATGEPRTLADWLPASTPSSLDLPDQLSVARGADGTFTVSATGATPLLTAAVAPSVELAETAGVPYGLDLTSATTIDLGLSLSGTVSLDDDGAATAADLTARLTAAADPVLSGGIGIAEATVEADVDLDVSIDFDLDEDTADTPVVTTASAALGEVTIAGLGPDTSADVPSDLHVDGASLLTVTWPSLPTVDPETRTKVETGVVVDSGWGAGGLQRLANVSIHDLLGAPGGVASWLSAAQTLGTLATPLPIVPDTIGDSIGMAQSLATVHSRVAAATAVAYGPLATTPAPRLSPDLCADLLPSAVRAAEVALAIENLDPDGDAPPTTEELLAELPSVSLSDTEEADVTAGFTAACGFLFDDVLVDLADGTIESAVDIPEASFDFFGAEDPQVDLSYEDADLGALAVALDAGTWTGTSTPALDFTLGLKLDSADALADHALAVDLADVPPPTPPVAADADDVTAAYRVYVPDGETLGASTVAVTGSGLGGFAQLGFLDLAVSGDVAITPTVTLVADDPDSSAFNDGKADLLELLSAAVVESDGTSGIDDVLTVDTTAAPEADPTTTTATNADDDPIDTADVDVHLTFENDLLGTTAALDVVGDLAGLIDEADIDMRDTAIAGPDDVDTGTFAIGHTFGDTLDLGAVDPTEMVLLVADALDAIATSGALQVGDERIPVIDVSLDEVAGVSTGLTDAATALRKRVPTSVTELQAFVDDVLASNGLGGATVGFSAGDTDTDPELTLELDASASVEASYPVSLEFSDSLGTTYNVAPTDGGSRLDAAVQVDFEPVIGVRLAGALPLADGTVLRSLTPRFDLSLSGDAEGSATVGPAEASLTGEVSIGDDDLDAGGFTVTSTHDGGSSIPLSALVAGGADVTVATDGEIDVDEELTLTVPTPTSSINSTIDIAGEVPGEVTFSFDDAEALRLTAYFQDLKPNLRTLANGAIETSRFIARGAKEVAALTGQVPVVGADVSAQFDEASAILTDVSVEIQGIVDLLDEDANNPVLLLQEQLDEFIPGICPLCSAEVRYTPEGTTQLLDAEGIEVLLTIAGEVDGSTSTSASFGLDPVLDLDVDISNAQARIGFTASIGLGVDIHDGFYLFPGIDGEEDDGVGTLFELYADLDLESTIQLTVAGLSATAEDATISVAGGLSDGTAGGLKIEMPDRLLISDLVNRSRKLSDVVVPSLDAQIDAYIPVEIALEVLPPDPFRVILPIEMDWTIEDTLKPDIGDANVAIVEAQLDIKALAAFLADVVREFDSQYNPLGIAEVKDALDTVVPLIDTSVRDTLVAVCKLTGSAGCTAFEAMANLGKVADELEALTLDGATLPIGSFQIYPAPPEGESRYFLPGEYGADVEPLAASGAAFAAAAAAPPPPAVPGNAGTTSITAKIKALTGGYMTLPILDELPAVMGVILGGELGEDIDVVRFEIPEDEPIVLGRSFAIKRTLLDLDTAFIDGHLSVNLNGGIGLNITGGFGFSTRAISTGNPLDGIFLIDNDGLEVSLGASVSAEVNGRFSVLSGLAEVQFRGAGSFSAVGGIDLFDESPVLVGSGGGDGRLYFDEIATIADAYKPPLEGLPSELCMFQLRTTGKWSLAFSGSAKVLGITIFDESFSDSGTLWDETLSCELQPRIARVEDRVLILHAGPNAADRFDSEGDVAESFTVTQVGSDALVTWTGASPKLPLSFPLDSFDSITADMGALDDSVTVADAILQPVLGRGGPGTDTIVGGGGGDDLSGGEGDDVVSGGAGDDVVRGGDGADSLNGGGGDDDMDGEGGGDTIGFGDSFGNDAIADSGDTADRDELDFSDVTQALVGDTAYGDSTVSTSDATASYPAADFEDVLGGSADDLFQLKDQEPEGFVIDGGKGADQVTFLAGKRARRVGATDSGGSASDKVTVLGGSAPDEFLLRAASSALGETASQGFVARLSTGVADRYDYDSSIEDLVVDGGIGDDEFALDDNASTTHVIGGPGADVVQVGQIYGAADCEPDGTSDASCSDTGDVGSHRGAAAGVDDPFATTVITRGHLSNGVTHALTVDGDDGADRITVFSNHAPVTANGGNGNDQFVARAFIVTASVTLNGDGDIDDFSYVMNDKLSIDGGAGTDTFTVIGTEANDGFVVGTTAAGLPTVKVCKLGEDGRPDESECAISAIVDDVEIFDVLGLEGDDVFWIQDSGATALVTMSGGEHSDRFLVGDGTLDGIDGPVIAAGDDSGVVPAIADPVVLPGEDTTPAFDPAVVGGTDVGDKLEIDASGATEGLEGEITGLAIRGFGMAAGPFDVGEGADVVTADEVLAYDDLEFIEGALGAGDDDVTITDTHVGSGACDDHGCPLALATGAGDDTVDVLSIDGETTIDLGAGDDTTTVGSPTDDGDTLDAINAHLGVVGGEGSDALDLDDTADGPSRLDVDPGLITEAGLDEAGVTHETVERIDVRLGDEADTVNIRGTATDAELTQIHGNAGDDRFGVSSAAELAVGETTDHLGGTVDAVHTALRVHGGAGRGNVLQISDREAAAGDAAVTYDGSALAGLAAGEISHDVSGAFGGGITIWTSEHDDTIAVTGSDRSAVTGTRTLTTLNTGDGTDTVTPVLAASQGTFVLNTEEGDDVVKGAASTLDLLVFGGLGSDDITTGSGRDVVVGDRGRVSTADGRTITGGGGPGDVTDGGTQQISSVTLLHPVLTTTTTADEAATGAADVIHGGPADDRIYGQVGDDDLYGGEGDDEIEGNAGADTINGEAGQDDLTGGGSDLDGILDADRSWSTPTKGLADGSDTILGGPDADVILGDNGWIVRTLVNGTATKLRDGVVIRDARVANADEVAGSYGADRLLGGDGPDELHGQRDTQRRTPGGTIIAGDELDGGDGDDVLIGDLGRVVTVLETGPAITIRDSSLFLSATLRAPNTRTRQVTLFKYEDGGQVDRGDHSHPDQFGAEGDDVLLGGAGADTVHGGAGDDLANGGAGPDVIFGGDGDDDVWGGPGADELFGGHDEDSLDVKPRAVATRGTGTVPTMPADPPIWFEVAGDPVLALSGLDIMYGGWNTDDMQADVKSNGPTPGDRLIDWSGAYNRYLGCGNGAGAGSFLRSSSPSLQTFLTGLAAGRGAIGQSGQRELGLVGRGDGNNGSVGGLDHVAC